VPVRHFCRRFCLPSFSAATSPPPALLCVTRRGGAASFDDAIGDMPDQRAVAATCDERCGIKQAVFTAQRFLLHKDGDVTLARGLLLLKHKCASVAQRLLLLRATGALPSFLCCCAGGYAWRRFPLCWIIAYAVLLQCLYLPR